MVWARGARVFACAGLLMALVVSTSLAASKGHKRTEKPDDSENSEPQETSSDSNDSTITANVKRRQATIAAMAVHEMANGKLIGDTLPLVATVSGGARNGKVSIRGHIGEEMKTALDEAERYVRIDYPKLDNANIVFSFEDKYTPKDGGSAGAAMTVLMRSILDGFEIDKHVAVTGDIAVNGNIQKIGGVSSKIRGAMEDGYTTVTLPKANAGAVSDLFVTSDKFDVLKGVQIFSVETIPDMVGIVRTDRDRKLDEAMTLYAQVQAGLEKGALAFLHRSDTQSTLKQVLELAPNHISAKYALDIAQGKGPETLTRTGSLVEIFSDAYPFTVAMQEVSERKGKKLTREMLPSDTMQDILKQLRAMRSETHPDVEHLRSAMVDWIDAVDRILSARRGQITRSDIAEIDRRANNLDHELNRLGTDQKLIAKLMREGY